jgi:hypothetical protein
MQEFASFRLIRRDVEALQISIEDAVAVDSKLKLRSGF